MHKTLTLFLVTLFIFSGCTKKNTSSSSQKNTAGSSQKNTEFKTYGKGLIYSDATMNTLKHLVDSLNLKFKKCDINKVFYAKKQTLGYYIQLDTGNVQQAKRDLEKQMPLEQFIKKYPLATVEKNVFLIKYKYTDYQNKEKVAFYKVDLGDRSGVEIVLDIDKKPYEQACKNTWVYEYFEKTEYSHEKIQAFYFPEEFESKPLRSKYANQINYADCLIDTTATIFKSNQKEGWVDLPENWKALPKKNKLKLLDEMRATKVIGFCSLDNRPREHALNIALLSAETTQWDIFLKAHLDIMNDHFSRVTDGSYAYGSRKTYIRELEDLNINLPDLVFGTALQVENAAENHYFASVDRMGRALAEAKDIELFKSQLIAMMADPELDHYNKIVAYYMLLNYVYNLEDKQEQKANEVILAKAVETLPLVLKEKINSSKNKSK